MDFLLLTHNKEIHRASNTGRLVLDVLGKEAQVIVWERTHPDPALLDVIEQGSVALVYPTQESQPLSDAPHYKSHIIIDGTWQEAKKIYDHSAYLKSLPTLKVNVDQKSLYTLRRNQTPEGLCTAEIVIELLEKEAWEHHANILRSRLVEFIVQNSQR